MCVHVWAGMQVTCRCAPTNVCSSNGEINSVYPCSSPTPPLPRNGGISSLHPWSSPPAPPPLPGRKRSLGESYSPYKDEKQNFVPGEQLRRSYISLTAHPPLPDDPITLPLFFQIGPHLFLFSVKPCCLCLSCSLRLLPMKLSSWRAPRA